MRHQYDDYVPPQRITASRPEEPYKMNTMYETQDRHYQNYKRVQAMQQRQWNREHMQYTIYPYSHVEEREMYKSVSLVLVASTFLLFSKQIRSTLKEQMEHKVQVERDELATKNQAIELIIEQDRQHVEQEKQRRNERARVLMQVTTKNKEVWNERGENASSIHSFQLMENKWDYEQWNRLHQWHVERAMLADNPINWSKTMT